MGASTVIVHACMDPLHVSLPMLRSTSGHMQALSHGWSRVPYAIPCVALVLLLHFPPESFTLHFTFIALRTTTYHWSWTGPEYTVDDCGDARSTGSELIELSAGTSRPRQGFLSCVEDTHRMRRTVGNHNLEQTTACAKLDIR